MCSFSMQRDSVVVKLDHVLKEKDSFQETRQRSISFFKDLLQDENMSVEQQYDTNKKLYQEYCKFITDSAIRYVLVNKELAENSRDMYKIGETYLQLAWLYSTKGLYIEAFEILNSLKKDKLSSELLPSYYWTFCEFYAHYASSNNEKKYYQMSTCYRDSLLIVLNPESLDYQIEYAKKLLYNFELEEARLSLEELLHNAIDTESNQALITYLIGCAYKEEHNIEMQKKYFSMSAVYDVTNCIKNNASLQELALVYYESGNLEQAFRFMQEAISNAIFCNAQFRTKESSEFYTIINSSFQEQEKFQKTKLKRYLGLISTLTLILIFITLYVFWQIRKLSKIRKELKYINKELKRLNEDLHLSNSNLAEANHVKEEYIAQFFNQCSKYISKLENYRKDLNEMAKKKQFEELYCVLKSTTIVDEELKELYLNFDSVFLNIYPSFIEDFNALLLPDQQITPKSTELLNTELRVYALIRLGITDSVSIANFLRCSLRTVYNYRTKNRNKASGSRSEFEENVKRIDAFNLDGTLKNRMH